MSENITIRVNDSLKAIYNTDDPIYKSLICNKNGVPETVIVDPMDFNLGVITNCIEYLRKFSIDLLKQLFIDQATGEFLKYELETFFKSLRLENETEATWIERTIALVFKPKISRASIIYALRSFSSQEPEIIDGSSDSSFADVSFADRYIRYSTTFEGEVFNVYPAFSQTDSSSYFSIIVVLYNTPSSQIYTIIDIINKYIAAGISFKIEIRTI